jgi:hypothetical protein
MTDTSFSDRFAASASAWLPWLYDTVVIILVIWKSLQHRRSGLSSYISSGVDITQALIKDGLLYYT